MVPTMGALHDGHLELVRRAVKENTVSVVSIFVNPLQFNERDDFKAYPRDIGSDSQLLKREGCDMVFTGTLLDFFPEAENADQIVMLEPGPFAEGLEGSHRPGHFSGVRTIVERLFRTVHPDRAYFGEKDFQQTLVVKDLAQNMGYPEIVVCPTRREESGLAMSSRNQLLTPDQRDEAAIIYRALLAARDAWSNGERRATELSAIMHQVLDESSLDVEYAEIKDPLNWTRTARDQHLEQAQALIAARCGDVRLIDNLRLHNH